MVIVMASKYRWPWLSAVIGFCLCTVGFCQEIERFAPTSDPISKVCLHPWKGDFRTPDQVELPADEVYFTNETGKRLRGWLFTADESQQTILFCMGNSGNISLMLPYARILQDAGFEVLLFDYQGFGNSEGIASVSSLLGDCTAAFEFLVDSRQRKPEEIGVFGVSLGSVLAITLAAEKQAGPVAVEDVFVPNEQIDKLAKRYVRQDDRMAQFAMATLKALFLNRVDPIQNVKKLRGPLFLLHGVNDWLLPPSGTIKVAKVSQNVAGRETRVWLMDECGHAPESLEVNDDEYVEQLQTFFTSGFRNQLAEPQMNITSTQKEGRRWVVTAIVDCGENQTQPQPLQLAFADEWGRRHFHKGLFSGRQQVKISTYFSPSHLSAVKFHNVDPVDGSWQPRLSVYSRALKEYRGVASRIFGGDRRSESFVAKEGEYFYTVRSALRRLNADQVKSWVGNLPKASELPERIRTRYALLLARLDRWPAERGTTGRPERSGVNSWAELMLQYLPDDPDSYYEIGNARFQLKLRDAVIADALFNLAKQRLASGRIDEARQLLTQHVSVLPASVSTNLNNERIASIQDLEDLVGTD